MFDLLLTVTILIAILVVFGLRFRQLYRKEKGEKEQLKALFENATEGILLVDSSGRIVQANPVVENIFGYNIGELAGNELSVLIPKGVDHSHTVLVNKYLSHPYSTAMGRRVYALRKNGSEFLADISLSHFRDRGSINVIAFVTDASERALNEQMINSNLAKANEELLRSQSLYKAMAHNFPDGIIGVMGRDMKYLLVDGKGLSELGLDQHSMKGDRLFDNIHKTISGYAEHGLKKVYEGESISFDVTIEGNFYNVSSVPIYTKSEINEILVVIKNISDQKKMEQELINTLEKEKELNTLKSRFVTMASHEFRTPLTTILSSTFLLENYTSERLQVEKHKHLTRIKHAVHNLTELLNDFLSLGKLEEGKVEVALKPLKLREFFEEIMQEVLLTKKEDQRIVFEFHGNDHETLMDRNLLRNVLLNLLSNAIKYSPHTGSIGLTVFEEPQTLKIKVSDSGIGIPPEEQKHIFQRFFRANNTMDIQGTGLGLNIVRRYVRLLKGKIDFTSTLNKGTTFNVLLPLNSQQQDGQKDEDHQLSPT